MPASTPIYGITYPCGGDTIDPDALATFATSMDAALAQGAADLAEVTARPNAQGYEIFVAFPVAVNVATDLGYLVEAYDNDGMLDLSASTTALTIRTSGAYLIWAMYALSGFATLTSQTVILTVNNIERGRYKSRKIAPSGDGQVSLCMPMNLVAGDVVRAQALWTGTGGPASAQPRILSGSFIAAP